MIRITSRSITAKRPAENCRTLTDDVEISAPDRGAQGTVLIIETHDAMANVRYAITIDGPSLAQLRAALALADLRKFSPVRITDDRDDRRDDRDDRRKEPTS